MTGVRVAYLVSRFPRLTETFVVTEVEAAVRAGADVQLFPLRREAAEVVQPAARGIEDRVHHHQLVSGPILASLARALRRRPATVLHALFDVVRHNLGSRRLLVGAVASFPLAVHLAERFRAEGIEHVHAHFATHPAAVALVVHRLTGIPFSFTAHGSDIHRDQHMLAQKVQEAAFVAAVSHHNRTVVLEACRRAGLDVEALADRVRVVRCGVDPDRFPSRPPRPRSAGDPLHVLVVGTLHEVKGQAHLIEACRLARAAGVDVRLTIVGDGPDRPALEDQVAEAGLAEHVRFVGAVAQPVVGELLAEADLLVAPSVPSADGRREGLPVVILEAMATGVPVVASRLSGIPEVVRHDATGVLVEPGDAIGLAAALIEADRDPARAQDLAVEARALVDAEFDVGRSARTLVDLFAGAAS